MKAQHCKKNEGPGGLAMTDQRAPSWPLPSGLLMADSGLLMIAFAGWEALRASPQTLLYSCGATLCFAGLTLIWIGTTNLVYRLANNDDVAGGQLAPTANHGDGAVALPKEQTAFSAVDGRSPPAGDGKVTKR